MNGKMTIYVASSFRNVDNVEILIKDLRGKGFDCYSWRDNNVRVSEIIPPDLFDFSKQLYNDDLREIGNCDLLIYYPPAGCDASFELGYAKGLNKVVIGVSKEDSCLGVMGCSVVNWFDSIEDLLSWLVWYRDSF